MTDVRYLAGFFDGEGYVGVKYQAPGHHMLQASVTNNYRPVLELYLERYGGRIYQPQLPSQPEKEGKLAWTWKVYGQGVIDMLRELLPYLVGKREQAELAVLFPIGKHRQRVNPEVRVLRQHIFERLQQLKHHITEPDGCYLQGRIDYAETDRVQQVIGLYEQGLTTEEVAQRTGVSAGMVAYWTRQLGVSRGRSAGGKIGGQKRVDGVGRNPAAQQAKELYEQGIPIAEIARQVATKPATVNYWLRRLGVTRSLSEAQQLRRKREQGS